MVLLNTIVEWGNDVPQFVIFLFGSFMCFALTGGVFKLMLDKVRSAQGRFNVYLAATLFAGLAAAKVIHGDS